MCGRFPRDGHDRRPRGGARWDWLSGPPQGARQKACRWCGSAGAETERGSDLVAGEEPLEIRIGGERLAVTMRTPVPGQDAELALGFVLAEGILGQDQIARISECRSSEGDGGVADVLLRPGAAAGRGLAAEFLRDLLVRHLRQGEHRSGEAGRLSPFRMGPRSGP